MEINQKSCTHVSNATAVNDDKGNSDDQRDMQRMGKTQQLRVCSYFSVESASSTQVFHYFYSFMGSC